MSSTNPQQYTTSHATPAPVAPARTNGLAVAALVLGIVWVYWIGSILAVIFGAVALHQIEQSPGQGGRGMAVAGLVLGLVGVGVLVLVLLAKATSGVA
jgi:hypothetical protein